MKISNTYIAGNLIDEPTGKKFNLILFMIFSSIDTAEDSSMRNIFHHLNLQGGLTSHNL